MAGRLELWCRAERGFLQDESKYFKAGGKVISPSGVDITVMKSEELANRLEGLNLVLKEVEDASESEK